MRILYKQLMRSGRYFLVVGGFDAGDIGVHLLVHALQLVCVLLELQEFLLQGVQVVHCVREGVHHRTRRISHLGYLVLELLHLIHLPRHLLPLLFSLLLQLLSPLQLPLPLDFLLLLLLHFHDPIVHLHQEVGKLGVNFVDHIAEVGGSLVVDAFEEHDCLEVLREILHLRLRQFPLQDLDDVFLVGVLDLLSQVDHFLFDVDESLHVASHLGDPQRVDAHDFPADRLDFYIALVSDLVDEVPDGQLGTLRQDI